MPELTHTARFAAADALDRMLEDIACPACGYLDPADTYRLTPGNRVRFFCDGCGAFVTILLSDVQAEAVRHWSSVAGVGVSGDPVAGGSGDPAAGGSGDPAAEGSGDPAAEGSGDPAAEGSGDPVAGA